MEVEACLPPYPFNGISSETWIYMTLCACVHLSRSVTACNSPLNGSLVVYSLGEKVETAPAVCLGSHGHLLSVAIHMVELLDWAFVRRIFDPRYERQSFWARMLYLESGLCVFHGLWLYGALTQRRDYYTRSQVNIWCTCFSAYRAAINRVRVLVRRL